jgi:hypothetical protein
MLGATGGGTPQAARIAAFEKLLAAQSGKAFTSENAALLAAAAATL